MGFQGSLAAPNLQVLKSLAENGTFLERRSDVTVTPALSGYRTAGVLQDGSCNPVDLPEPSIPGARHLPSLTASYLRA